MDHRSPHPHPPDAIGAVSVAWVQLAARVIYLMFFYALARLHRGQKAENPAPNLSSEKDVNKIEVQAGPSRHWLPRFRSV